MNVMQSIRVQDYRRRKEADRKTAVEICRMNAENQIAFRRVAKLRALYGVAPGESLLDAMVAGPSEAKV